MKNKSARAILLAGASLAIATTAAHATTDLGNAYSPAGSNYTITAFQNLDASGSNGTKTGAQVNADYEFKGTLGVAYTDVKNKLTEFGLGIYSSNGLTLSTGLNVSLNQSSLASSVTVTMADFDIANNATSFKSAKVEPSILVYGLNNKVLFSADPTAIFNAMTAVPGQSDYWNLNFGKLLANAGQQGNQPIAGFLLYADSQNGEKVGSDPYFITSVNGGIPAVPEPGTYAAAAVLVALVLGAHARAVLQKKATRSAMLAS